MTASISPPTGCSQLPGERARNCESIGFWPFQVWWMCLCHLPVSVLQLLLQPLLHLSPSALFFLCLLLSFCFIYLPQPSTSALSTVAFLLPLSLIPPLFAACFSHL